MASIGCYGIPGLLPFSHIVYGRSGSDVPYVQDKDEAEVEGRGGSGEG